MDKIKKSLQETKHTESTKESWNAKTFGSLKRNLGRLLTSAYQEEYIMMPWYKNDATVV